MQSTSHPSEPVRAHPVPKSVALVSTVALGVVLVLGQYYLGNLVMNQLSGTVTPRR